MKELYEKLEKFRDESYSKINNSTGEEREKYSKDFEYAKDVLIQLFKLAFFNKNEPDTLPNVFEIRNAHYTAEEFETFMKAIGYNIEADMTSCCNIAETANFKVTMAQK